jgi:hypothetical protein
MKIDRQTDHASRAPAIALPVAPSGFHPSKPTFLIANALLESYPTHSKQNHVTFSNRKWMAISKSDFSQAVSYLTHFRTQTSIVALQPAKNFDRVTL